jgi:hypothetical protein
MNPPVSPAGAEPLDWAGAGQMGATTLYAIRECSDVFVDAALRDSAGELMFLSMYGRDTAMLHFLASFTLPVGNGGRSFFTLVRGDEHHKIGLADPARLDKLTGRLPRENLFGNLTHVWLYHREGIQPDRSNRSALLLRFGESDEAFAMRIWSLVRDLSPVPLLDHWREPLMEATGELLITPLSAGNAPPIGVVDGARLSLPDAFEQIVSAAVADGALTLDAGDLPTDCVARVRRATSRLCPATAAGDPAGVDSP